jgi:alkyldihydroxyacetonephosphate synthase
VSATWTTWAETEPELAPDAWTFLRRRLGAGVRPNSRPAVPREAVRLPEPTVPGGFVDRLSDIVGAGNVYTDDASRLDHAGGQSYPDLIRRRAGHVHAPDVVVYPPTPAAVAALLAACSDAEVAVVPYGGGTSVVGGVEPLAGRFSTVVCVDLARLDQLVAVDRDSLLAVLQPGLRTPAAEAALAAHSLTLGHFPQSYERASIGGYVVTRSAGQASAGYGRIDDLVLGLRLATPQGELVLPAQPGSAAGPDLRRLVLGSEGTFGIVTEVTLRVHPQPPVRRYEAYVARTWDAGLTALRQLAQAGPTPDIVRLSDHDETDAGLHLSTAARGGRTAMRALLTARAGREACLVIVGFEGTADDVRHRRRVTKARFRADGLRQLGQAPGQAWAHNRYAGPRLRDTLLSAGVLAETLETASTWNHLPQLYDEVRTALQHALGDAALIGCHVSHVYPTGASLYFTALAAARAGDEEQQWNVAKKAAGDAIRRCGATITHHHAVGTAHSPWLAAETGQLGIDVLRAVKARLDPVGILNPGKLLPVT